MDFSKIDSRDTLYRRLMLDPSADADMIQVVYRRLARRHHPDVDPSPEAQHRMAALNEAYAVLRDPALRCQYDAALAASTEQRSVSATVTRFPSNGGSQSFGSYGEAGPPDGPAAGSTLDFGRYRGWTLGQIRRRDPDFLEWLVKMPIGRPYRDEIWSLLRRTA